MGKKKKGKKTRRRNNGKRFYCDYCDCKLGLSLNARKEHVQGKEHRAKVRAHYQQFQQPELFNQMYNWQNQGYAQSLPPLLVTPPQFIGPFKAPSTVYNAAPPLVQGGYNTVCHPQYLQREAM